MIGARLKVTSPPARGQAASPRAISGCLNAAAPPAPFRSVQQPPQRLTQVSVARYSCFVLLIGRLSMAQHFLLSAAARSLNPSKVMRMSDRRAEKVFARLRWPQTDGKPVCPRCGGSTCYSCPRSADQPRWRCKACRADFSITSGTLFASHKLPLKNYLMAIATFCNQENGKSMLAFSRDLGVQYRTAFALAHKLREAMIEP